MFVFRSSCEEDWLEIWNVMASQDDRLVGRYCGSTAPGPIESREKAVALKVIMHTDEEGVYSGFKARYVYFTAKTLFGGKCFVRLRYQTTRLLKTERGQNGYVLLKHRLWSKYQPSKQWSTYVT